MPDETTATAVGPDDVEQVEWDLAPLVDADGLRDAMRELGTIAELAGRAGTYAMLRFAVDTADPERGALLQRVQELGTAIETKLLFFDLEWAALDDEHAEALLAAE